MASRYRELIKELREQGVMVERGTKHLTVRYRGELIAILPRNLDTDDTRGLQNTLAALRRAGLKAGGR